MALSAGTYISGGLHVALLGAALVGVGFENPKMDFDVADVSVISTQDFIALTQSAPPEIQTQSEQVVIAAPEETAPVVQSAPDTAPATAQPVPNPQASADATPAVRPAPLAPLPEPVITAPEGPATPPPSVETSAPLTSSLRPVPRPAPRVAPRPAAPTENIPDVSPTVREETAPDPSADVIEPEQEASAPEEATTEIVTEAETPSSAPTTSMRPMTRPANLARAEPEPAPAPEPAPEAVAVSETAPTEEVIDPVTAALNAALEEALAAAADVPAPTDDVPPLTSAEIRGFQVALSNCWNLGAASSDAMETTVVVGWEMRPDGRPVQSSIRLVSQEGGSSFGVEQAFDAARRAILRCGAQGFDLPVEKFPLWQNIEMKFNPESMRVK